MKLPWQIALALVLAAGAADAQAQMRFRGMDANGDGVITRSEWRGNDRSFRNQDWDGDGVLSGDEVREGARRQNWNQDWNRDGRVDNEDRPIAERFRGYDMNNDGRVTAAEWSSDDRLFARLDTNRDRLLTMQEYTAGAGFRLDSLGGPAYGFSGIDRNRDGWISRGEWRMGAAEFNRIDTNNDNRISRFEFETVAGHGDSPVQYDRFASVDSNRDGWLTRSEWRGSEAVFTRLDANRDNRLSRTEYDAEVKGAPQTQPDQTPGSTSAAWRMGYDRGIAEGMVAGRQDYNRNQGWDLEGQRELVNANSGYQSHMGSLNDYQGGYREGFRNAYRAGFLEARDNRK
jgi:Ca2+-binding EF-hand superfamily protein